MTFQVTLCEECSPTLVDIAFHCSYEGSVISISTLQTKIYNHPDVKIGS